MQIFKGLYVTEIRKNKRETIIKLANGRITKSRYSLQYYLKNPEKVERKINEIHSLVKTTNKHEVK